MAAKRIRFGLTWGLLTLLASAWGGCSEKGLVRDFRIPSERRAALTSASLAGAPLRVPADATFNITDKTSRQSPGMGGSARGESDARGKGTAFCRIEAAQGGSGSAEFQLGHCFDNRATEAMTAEASFACEYAVQARLTNGPDAPTTGEYAMEIYVNDSDGRLLKRVPVESSAGDESIGGTVRFLKTVAVRLEPNRVYNFVVAGKVDAETAEGGSAELSIEVKKLELTLRTSPAGDAS